MKQFSFIFAWLVCAAALSAGEMVWKGADLEAWSKTPRRTSAKMAGGNLVLTDNEKDFGIFSPDLQLNPAEFNAFSIRYRARESSEVPGQFYFQHAGDTLGPDRAIAIRFLNDEAWHTLESDITKLQDPTEWTKKGTITKVRIDPSDGAGGVIEIAEIRFFKKDGIKVASDELPKVSYTLDEGKWSNTTNEVWKEAAVPPVKGPYFTGKLIKSPKDTLTQSAISHFYLRREFTLKAKPVEAWVQFCADNVADCYLNGKKVARNTNWIEPTIQNVTGNLVAGKNIWAFDHSNTKGPGGVVGEILVRYADGSTERLVTDGSFRSTAEKSNDWAGASANTFGWEGVIEQKPGPNPPWEKAHHYKDISNVQKFVSGKVAGNALKAGDETRLIFRFVGKPPVAPFDATLEIQAGKFIIWHEKLEITAPMIQTGEKGEWSLLLPYTLPLYLNTHRNAELRIRATSLCTEDDTPIAAGLSMTRAPQIPGFAKSPVVRVVESDSGPYIAINGTPFFPMWGAMVQTDTRRPDGKYYMSKGPVNVMTVYASQLARAWWVGDGEYNFAEFDRVAELYRRDNPDAWFVMDISLYPPKAWCEKYPEELALDEKGRVVRDAPYAPASYSISSKVARKALMDAALAAVDYIERSPYANRVIGYRINGGHTLEWLGWHAAERAATDFSKPNQEGFAAYAAKYYPELQDRTVPKAAERATEEDGMVLWDAQKHLKAVAYNHYMSDSMVATFAPIWRAVKKRLAGRKLQGGYYGYTATLFVYGSEQWRSHFALEKMFRECEPDFLICPIPYDIRELGDPIGDMKPFTTMKNHNIINIQEDDVRTHNQLPVNFPQRINEAQSINSIRRDMATELCRNNPCYYFAITRGTEFDFPAMERDIATERVIGDYCIQKRPKRNAEIAIVFSEKTVTGMPVLSMGSVTGIRQHYKTSGEVEIVNNWSVAPNTEVFRHDTIRTLRLGAPVDFLLAEDLIRNPGKYKLYIFANCYVYDENVLKAVEKLRERECVMLWSYAPGYTFKLRNDVKNMERLTGIPFQEIPGKVIPAVKLADGRVMGTQNVRIAPMFEVLPAEGVTALGTYADGKIGAASRKVGKATSIFTGAYQFDMPFLADVAQLAGVFRYSTSTDPLDANDNLVMLHARFAGEKTVKLPRKTDVIDIFNRKLVGKNIDTVTFNAPLHSTWFFYYGDDAETVLQKLETLK